jgi:hypothetical protein
MTVERASSTLRRTIAARHGDAVVVEEGDVGAPAACYIHSCASSMRSGLRADNASSWCSTAFTTASRGTFSAAHCGYGARYHQGYYFGYVQGEQQSGPVDAELINVGQSGFNARAWIMDDGQTATRPVTSMGLYQNMGVGNVVCKTGATTGRSCGTVDAVNTSVHWVPNSYNFVRAAGMCARGGDSGSGIYINNQAVGILSGADTDDNCSVGGNYTWFGHIHYATNALGHGVRTYESAPYFSSAYAPTAESRVTVDFDLPVSCGSVQTYDFTVEIAGVAPLTVTGDSCTLDSDKSFDLYLNAPVPANETIEVALAGTVTDPAGNTVARRSHGIYP